MTLNKYGCLVLVLFGLEIVNIECTMSDGKTASVCEHILPFHGGDVIYFEDQTPPRAYYSCKDAYTLFPNIDSSLCTKDMEWSPAPPECLKKAKVKIPRHGYVREAKDILLHNESYNVYCNKGYELYRDSYLGQNYLSIKNNNGTLEPTVPKCREARCDPDDQFKAVVSYTNGSRVTSKILSRTKVRLSCEDGYKYYRDGIPLRKPVIRKCEKGVIKAPVCKEERCLFSGYPGNSYTFHRLHRFDHIFLVPNDSIHAKDQIEVICFNKEDFELYVNSTQTYLERFTSECRYGQFNETATNFPICLEKRCHFEPNQHVCLSIDGNGVCEEDEFKVQSGSHVAITCKNGYKLYRSEDGSSVEVINETSILCRKGNYFQDFKCIPESVLRKVLKYAAETGKPFDTTLHRLSCRFSAFGSENCSDPCLSGDIPFELTDGGNISGEAIHGYQASLNYKNIGGNIDGCSVTCNNGEWEGFEDCVYDKHSTTKVTPTKLEILTESPKGCSLPSDEIYTYLDDEGNKVAYGSNISSGTNLTVICTELDYDYYSNYDGNETLIPTITCKDTELSQINLYCPEVKPDPCMELVNGRVTKVFGQYNVSCNSGFSLNLVIPEKSLCTCEDGVLRSNLGYQIPACIPDNCVLPYEIENLSVIDRYRVYLSGGSTVKNGQYVFFNCSIVDKQVYEPVNRRFKCVNGRWIENEKDPNWKLGTNGDFPACRKAICEPECQNRGVCFKDGNCKCKHLTSGERCENVLCDRKCRENDGTCVAPGQCSCPEGRFGFNCEIFHCDDKCLENGGVCIAPGKCSCPIGRIGFNCEQIGCILPDQSAKPKNSKLIYIPGDTLWDFRCQQDYILSSQEKMTCQDDGSWSDIVECVEGCMLPSDKMYIYMDFDGNKVEQGSNISNGTTLTVMCTEIDYNSANYVDYETTYESVTCTNNELSQFALKCPDVANADTCMELLNGIVTRLSGQYKVSCNEGFSLNLIKTSKEYLCFCQNGVLRSYIGNQIPVCKPDDCILPYHMDARLFVTDIYKVALSGGFTVANGDDVFFNCSKVDVQKYEPSDRRFKCLNGQWIENDIDPNWRLGNNGHFPTCREAICEPNCYNEGVCYKDNGCRCKQLTEGQRCENVLCGYKCAENGGDCVSGKCLCPPGQFGDNCEKSCKLPGNIAKPKKSNRVYYPEDTEMDFECEHGYVLSSQQGMTCQDNGSWSGIVTCIEAFAYLIRVKTADDLAGTYPDGNVYIHLHGQKGKTERIYLSGNFKPGDLDETSVMEKDLGPITNVFVGHNGKGNNWFVEFVSISIESVNEYYVFRNDGPVLVLHDTKLSLEDNCIHTFDNGHNWSPRNGKIGKRQVVDIGKGNEMSQAACKQACVELMIIKCVSVQWNKHRKKCLGFSVTGTEHFRRRQGMWNSPVFERSCKHV